MSFKVGDKVMCVKESGRKVNVGEIYTVESCGIATIRVKEIERSYWMDCFELATEEIRVGDVWASKFSGEMVRIVGFFRPFGVSRVSILVLNGIRKGCAENLDADFFIDGYTKKFDKLPSFEEKDHRDLAISKQHICMPRNAGRNFAMEQIAGALFNKTGYIKVWNGKEWEWTAAPATHPTVTKIIHNGTTTITFFSDGKKVITRPSQDDAEKYDPFIGWCVGVVEHLYGGKEKAKKFYKKHAVVQKEAQARASLNGNRRRGN